jgi:hypothetical protein
MELFLAFLVTGAFWVQKIRRLMRSLGHWHSFLEKVKA